MRSLFAITLILLGASAARAEWTTRVTDSSAAGMRMVELMGRPSGQPDTGLVLVCFPDSPGDSALIYANHATKDYAHRQGDRVSIMVGPTAFAAELTVNDSSGTSAMAAGVSPLLALEALRGANWTISVKLDAIENSAISIDSFGHERAAAEFEAACDA